MHDQTENTRSMFRSFVPADFVTIANVSSGMISILLCLTYLTIGQGWRIWLAMALLLVAMLCDYADGFIARKQARRSKFGPDLDSLADIVSFGVAPVILGFALGMRGLWDCVVFVFFVVCGVSRLARFNATREELTDRTGKVKYFEGTPIPTSVVIVMLLAVLYGFNHVEASLPLGSMTLGLWSLHPLVLIYAVSGAAMVSRLKIPKI
jgi:CDP-diacylglycerol--serine O-phosphatidyltransferase